MPWFLALWFPLTLFQVLIRSSLVTFYALVYGVFIHWVLIAPGEEQVFLTGLKTLWYLHIDRLIVIVVVSGFLFIHGFLVEYLWVLSLSRQYYSGKKISVRKTFLEVLQLAKMNFKVQTIKYLVFIFIISISFFLILLTSTLLSQGWTVIISIFIMIYTVYVIFKVTLNFNDISQRVFEYKTNIFEIYNYKIEPARRKKIFHFYMFKLLFLGTIIALFPFIQLFLYWGISTINWLNIQGYSLIYTLLFLFWIIWATIFSFLFVSFFTLRATRLYYQHHNKIATVYQSYKERKYLVYKRPLIIGLSIITTLSIFIGYYLFYWYFYSIIHIPNQGHIFAHRASLVTPTNNSIPALKYSIENQIEYVEIDIQLSKDNILVLFHDLRYNDGKIDKYIINTPLEDIKKYDLLTWENQWQPEVAIPTLREFLQVAKNNIKVNIEIKNSEGFEDIINQKLSLLIQELSLEKQVIITSFNYKVLEKIKQNIPEIETGLVITAYIWEINDIKKYNVDWIMVNNIYFDIYKDEFLSFPQNIVLWSFTNDFNGEIMLYEDIQGVIVDDPLETKKMIKRFHNLSDTQKIYESIEYYFFQSSNSSLLDK